MRCHRCATERALSGGDRIGFAATCEGCSSDSHCCANCAHHDPAAYNECRESSAERVSDRERANRCEYFLPRPDAGASGEATQGAALDELAALFQKGPGPDRK